MQSCGSKFANAAQIRAAAQIEKPDGVSVWKTRLAPDCCLGADLKEVCSTMGTVTQFLRAAVAARGGHRISKRLAASIMLASACAFSSATAVAGLREISPASSANSLHRELPESNSTGRKSSPTFMHEVVTQSSDPLSVDPEARVDLLSRNAEMFSAPVPELTQVKNATAKVESTQPLLIPLPNAVSVGLLGLAAVAVIGAAKRFRRKLFA